MAAGLFSVAALPALAQQPPLRLVPLDPPAPAQPPLEAPARAPAWASGGIQVQELRAPSMESIGVLDPRQGGLGPRLWEGTPATVVRRLLPLLPAANGSHVMRDLARRLLLTAAAAPEGADAAAAGGPTLVEMRAERLMALGDTDGMAALAAAAPGSATRPLLTRLAVDADLAAGRADKACAAAASALAAGHDGALAMVQVYCTFAAGNTLQGNLALDLLRERKEVDPAFVAAAEVMAGLPPVPADKLSLPQPAPVHVAAFAAAKQPLPADALAGAGATTLKAMALSGLPAEQRLAAAERAEALGALDAEAVRKLYGEQPFTPADLSAAIPKAEAGGPAARALLFRAAQDMPDEGVRAQIVAKALELATAKGERASAMRVFQPLIEAIRPVPEQHPFAIAAARALYAFGRPEAAAKWLDVARMGPAPAAVDALWPYAAVAAAGGGQPIAGPGYAGWRAAQAGVAPELAARRAAIVLGVLAGLGARVPDAAWLDTLALPPGGPRPGLFALMQGGALDARAGITVLAALAAIGEVPLDKAEPLAVSEAVSALTVVGLAADARALAIEALVANGI